jgi:hypothetical protein
MGALRAEAAGSSWSSHKKTFRRLEGGLSLLIGARRLE